MTTLQKKTSTEFRYINIYIYIYLSFIFISLREREIYIYMYIPGYSLVTNFWPGQILVWFLSSFFKFVHFIPFQNKMTISRKNLPLHVLIFKSCWVCPGISAFFPGISAFFPRISAQKNRHIFTQRRVRSAQEVGSTKLTTLVKKWLFPGPSHEIRPKGRNLANG